MEKIYNIIFLKTEWTEEKTKELLQERKIEFKELEEQLTKCELIGKESDVDVTDSCKNIEKKLIKTKKDITLDIIINNAGISMRALFKDLDLLVLRNLMDVNFWGAVYCTKYALPELIKNRGSVVGVSSIAGYRGLPGRTGYSASKFALNGFLESLRVENLKTGLHVMIASPGFTSSNIRNVALAKDGTSQGETSMDEDKMMSSDEVAAIIVKGIEQRKRSLIMTSQGKLTVFLNKIWPSWLDGLVYNHFTKEKNPLIK